MSAIPADGRCPCNCCTDAIVVFITVITKCGWTIEDLRTDELF